MPQFLFSFRVIGMMRRTAERARRTFAEVMAESLDVFTAAQGAGFKQAGVLAP